MNGANGNNNSKNKYNAYNAPMKNNNGITKRSYTRRASNVQFRGKNVMEDSLFTRTELMNLINKSILFLFKMKQKSFANNVNSRSGKRINLFNTGPLYHKLIIRLPILSIVHHHNESLPVIKFSHDNVYVCNSIEQCLNDDAIDSIEIKCGVLNGVDVAYFVYNGENMTAIAKEPTFMNSLTEKEQAFMKLIFDNANVLTNAGYLLAGFEVENIGTQLNAITNKNRTSRLRFSNKVHIKEIPNRQTMKNLMRSDRNGRKK
jgi:hypothetical protein